MIAKIWLTTTKYGLAPAGDENVVNWKYIKAKIETMQFRTITHIWRGLIIPAKSTSASIATTE